jgi:hypothetical protein
MARTAIPIQTIQGGASAAVTFTNADAANGMEFENDGATDLIVKNDDASPKTVTVVSVADEAGRTGDLAPSVAAGEVRAYGKLRPAWWNQSNGKVNVNFSAATNLKVAAVRRPSQ